MSGVIEELSRSGGDLDQARVAGRVQDWRARISGLYDQLRAWLPARFSADAKQSVLMNEELMREYNVAPAEIPLLTVFENGERVAKLVPRGLWIIGSNGRLDLFTRTSQWIVVDRSENFATRVWQIAPADHRRNSEPLTAETWLRALGA